jgi:hypothetical protein
MPPVSHLASEKPASLSSTARDLFQLIYMLRAFAEFLVGLSEHIAIKKNQINMNVKQF